MSHCMQVGTTLRHAREQQQLSLGDVAERTNISLHVLEAIDQNALDQVPGGLFTRGYLRAYAAAVGLDGDCIVGDYLSQLESPEEDVFEKLQVRFQNTRPRRDTTMTYQLLLVIAGLACLLFFLTREPAPFGGGGGDAEHDEQRLNPVEVSWVVGEDSAF